MALHLFFHFICSHSYFSVNTLKTIIKASVYEKSNVFLSPVNLLLLENDDLKFRISRLLKLSKNIFVKLPAMSVTLTTVQPTSSCSTSPRSPSSSTPPERVSSTKTIPQKSLSTTTAEIILRTFTIQLSCTDNSAFYFGLNQ